MPLQRRNQSARGASPRPALSGKAPTLRMNVVLFGGALHEAARWDGAALDEIIPCGPELRPRAHAMEGYRRMLVEVGERAKAKGVTAHALDRRTFRPRPTLPIETEATRSQGAFEVPLCRVVGKARCDDAAGAQSACASGTAHSLRAAASAVHDKPNQGPRRRRTALDASSIEHIANSTLAGVITPATHPHKAVAGKGHLR